MSTSPTPSLTTPPGRRHAPPGAWRTWLMAVRMPTLPASVVPVTVGSAAALAHGAFSAPAFAAALVSALCIQIGTNLANDVYDYRKGADTQERLGPTRVTQSGLLTPAQVSRGMWISFALAFAVGMYLVYLGGWPILAIGVLSILCGVWYTAGPWALAYVGLGDAFAFLFFGVIAVVGTFFVHAGELHAVAVWSSLPVACLVTAILVVNNLRDIETDRKVNKRTLAVRIGAPATRAEYVLLLLTAYGVAFLLWLGLDLRWAWLPLLSLPLGTGVMRALLTQTGAGLNPVLVGTGKLHLVYGVLLAIGLIASRP